MKIGLSVQEFFTNSIEKNLNKLRCAAEEACQLKIDLLCFGEAVLQGFFALNGNYEKDRGIALTLNSQPIRQIREIAKLNKTGLAVGYLENDRENLYSSYLVVDKHGEILCNYRRISPGWKEPAFGEQYKEGDTFGKFSYLNKDFSVALCGDLWFDDSRLSEVKNKIVLWPVFIDSSYADWENKAVEEYAEQAGKAGEHVLLVNSVLNEEEYVAQGRAVHFHNGKIAGILELKRTGTLIVEL